ncbi:hypothetical protein [Acidicapsa acidisoli]|uniref:hypothetical protein n=1 Tax=Acidicapsa acidisoli TaxID=1615681 RepID=UPI0021DF687E|nr:hypothetical protein [Acidicapsa acidisoli]
MGRTATGSGEVRLDAGHRNGHHCRCSRRVERIDNAVRKVFTVSEEEMQRREAEWQKTNGKKTESKKS